MIRSAIFDLDGTLLDSNPCWLWAGERYLANLGVRAQPGLGEALFAMTLPEAADYMKAAYRLSRTPEEICAGVNAVVEGFYRQEAPLKDGVTALLEAFKQRGIPMAVATVTDRHLVEAALAQTGVGGYFQDILTTAEVGVGKQSPEIYIRTAEALGSAPEETLVFEDALHALQTAKAAGFKTVGVYDAASEREQEEIQRISDHYLKNYRDLTAFFTAIDGY